MIQRWTLDPDRSWVQITASSTLHDTKSRGSGLMGEAWGDLDDLDATAGGRVRVPLKKQSFGDRMRNFAMHRHIDVKRWPEAAFEVEAVETLSRDPWRIRVSGSIEYRGQRVPLVCDAEGSLDAQGIEAETRFALRLPDLGVRPPKLLWLKVADSVDVEVKIVAKPSP